MTLCPLLRVRLFSKIALCTILAASSLFLSFRDARGEIPPNTKVLRDIEYVPGGGRSRSLDLYLPEAAAGTQIPLIIWIHGGAWREGSKDADEALWLLREGFAMASINYRLSTEAKFPAQIQDCKAAVRYLRGRAPEFGIDRDRIGVCGSSAGGHLALLLGTTAGITEFDSTDNIGTSSRVQAVCDFCGPTDFITIYKQMGEESIIRHDEPSGPVAQLLGGVVQDNLEKAKAASPVTYVTPDDPPFLILHGDKDPLVPLGQSREMQAALEAAGVKSTLHVVENGGHGDRFDPKEIAPLVRDFFVETLKAK